MDTSPLVPIDVSSAVMKANAKWLTELAEYMRKNPQTVVNRFEKTGIISALSGDDTTEENPSDSCKGSQEDEYASEDEEFDYAE